MAVDPERQERLRQMQQRDAADDPDIMKLDPANEVDADALELADKITSAMAAGEPLTIEMEVEEGRIETLTIQPIGEKSDGTPIYAVDYNTPDGKLSDKGSAWLQALLTPSFEAELATMIGE